MAGYYPDEDTDVEGDDEMEDEVVNDAMARALRTLDLWVRSVHLESRDCDRDLTLTYGPWKFQFAFWRSGADRSLTYRVATDERWQAPDLRAMRPPSSDILAVAGQELFQVRRTIAEYWAFGKTLRWLHDRLEQLHEQNDLPDSEVDVQVQRRYFTQDDDQDDEM